MGLFDKIKKLNIFSGFFSVDEDFFEELEENLILSDMGMDTTLEAVETLRERVKANKIKEPEEVKACLREILVDMLDVGSTALDLTDKPAVMLIIGVNGVGKTTTIGKLANLLKNQGNRVLLAAGDTFRAAAADQLAIWADRAKVDLVRHEEGSDPAAVVFDAMNDPPGHRPGGDGQLEGSPPGAGRHHGAERPHPGQAVWRERGHHRHRADQARRHRQGRRGPGHCQGDGRARDVGGPGRGHRRLAAL